MPFKIKLNQFRKYISYFLRFEKSRVHPTIFQIESTNACPMNCIMCPRQYMKRKIGFMNFGLYKRIVDQLGGYANKTGLLRLHHFGDPLLHPQLADFINYAHKKGLKTSISVNPTLLTDKIAKKLIGSELYQIQISLDGVNDSSYKKIRGKAANYKQAERNIKNFVKLKLKKGSNSKKPRILMGMVLMDATEELLEKFREKWNVSGIDEILVKPFSAFGHKDLLNLADKKGKEHIKRHALRYPCYWPWRNVVVLWDGRVVPCCWDYDGSYVLGDLKRESLKEIWNGKRMKELRRQHITGKFGNNTLCKNCVERYGAPGIGEPVKLIKYFIKRK